MAVDYYLLCSYVSCVFSLWINISSGLKTKTFYMDKRNDCDRENILGGATVYSHYQTRTQPNYPNDIDCRLTFKAKNLDEKLMLKMEYIDIPDLSYGLCDDAIYVYDAPDIFGPPIKAAGGTSGMCDKNLPQIIYSSGPYLTVYFRSDRTGESGRGFKFTITAFSEDYDQYGSCGKLFMCGNGKCIDPDLVCDTVDHCTDLSDEATDGEAECGKFDTKSYIDIDINANIHDVETENNWVRRILSLGITAAIGITVGSIVVVVVCTVCIVCFCCRCFKKRDQDPGGGGGGGQCTTTTATHVTINNGGPPPLVPGSYQHTGYNQQGYYPMHTAHMGPGSVTYSPFTQQRESYTHSQGTGSLYSSSHGPSYVPPSYHRSYTPTSSRSGLSHHSNSNDSSVKYSTNNEKLALPVNL